MEVLRDGTFSEFIDFTKLSVGLRPNKSVPRNTSYLTEAIGAVGIDGVLQSIPSIDEFRINTSDYIYDDFPFPQIFVLANLTLVCGARNIYEYVDGLLIHRFGPTHIGSLWSILDFQGHSIILTNGSVAVQCDYRSLIYELTDLIPPSEGVCNFNGQVLVGGPLE